MLQRRRWAAQPKVLLHQLVLAACLACSPCTGASSSAIASSHPAGSNAAVVPLAAADGYAADGALAALHNGKTPGNITGSEGMLAASSAAVDHYILALYWPPSVLSKAAQRRAQHLIHAKRVVPDFWTHGLWPAKSNGALVHNCSGAAYDPKLLGPFQRTLEYYQMPFDVDVVRGTKSDAFLAHEWDKHGTCTPFDQLEYFMGVYQASAHTRLEALMASRKVGPRQDAGYSLSDITGAINAVYPGALLRSQGVVCAPGAEPGMFLLQEVRLCVAGPGAWHPGACPGGTGGPPFDAPTCGAGDGGGSIYMPVYTKVGQLNINWGPLFGFLVVVLAVLGGIWGGYEWLKRKEHIPGLFLARTPKVVHYDLVQQPLKVCCEKIDMDWLWQSAPSFAEFIEDLPVGMAIKGGIARKLMKVQYGAPEPATKFDVDVVVFVDVYLSEVRRACRDVVTGMKLGALYLEPQDVEVLSKDWIPEYFMTRDVTQNEVLILKVSESESHLYYTTDALEDIRANLIRPSCHALKSEYAICWEIEEDGTPYIGPQQVVRSIVRYLKGHGSDYAFDAATWHHYRSAKLTKTQLFKILKPFSNDDAKMQAAVDHLVEIGFLSAYEVRKAGGMNMLWGLLLQELNATVSKFGNRLTLGEMDTEDVERWVDSKKAMVGNKMLAMDMKARRIGFVPSEENVQALGRLTFPPELVAFMRGGAVFDYEGMLKESASDALGILMTATSGELPESKALLDEPLLQRMLDQGVINSNNTGGARGLEAARNRWKAAQRMARVTNEAVLSGVVGPGADREDVGLEDLLPPEAKGDINNLRLLLGVEHAKELQNQKEMMARRVNKAARMRDGVLSRAASLLSPQRAASATAKPLAPPLAGGSDEGAGDEIGASGREDAGEGCMSEGSSRGGQLWLRYSAYGMAMARDNRLHGSFYQAALGSSLEWDEEGALPLVEDDERPQKQRVPLSRLLTFLLGVLDIGKGQLAVAYVLLLGSLALKLFVPRIEGYVFDAFTNYDDAVLMQALSLLAVLMAVSVTLGFAGRVVLEVFTRSTMRTVFARFYEHLIFQELSFFNRLNLGELMARTSGDSLTLRSIVSSTLYQFLEGAVLFAGSLLFTLLAAGPFLLHAPATVPTLAAVIAVDLAEVLFFGQIVRRLNLAVRQALGRMFGYTLDSFSKMTTVASLNMEPKLVKDYALFAGDYFKYTFSMNVTIAAHRAFTTTMGTALRLAVLYYGGAALFSDATTLGLLFAMLQYLSWMTTALKQMADAYVRLMAGAGSLERVVELHDRGVFGKHDDALFLNTRRQLQEGGSPGGEGGKAALPRAGGGTSFLSFTSASRMGGDGTGDSLATPLLAAQAGAGEVVLEPEGAPPPRPDWSELVGGVWMDTVFMSFRTKTDRSVLTDCSLRVKPGDMVLVTGGSGTGKTTMLATISLHTRPYKGHISFGVRTAAGDGGEDGWGWAAYSFLEDPIRAVRQHISICSVASAGVFHATVEDNVAVAALEPPSITAVHAACRRVGLDAVVRQLPDGLRTLVGEGTGHRMEGADALRISLARALVRRPRVLLLDDAELYAEAVGVELLQKVMEEVVAGGGCVIAAAYHPDTLPFIPDVYEMRAGRAWTVMGSGL